MRIPKKILPMAAALFWLATACEENSTIEPEVKLQAPEETYTKYDYERGENYEQTAMVLLEMVQKNPDLVRSITNLVKNERPKKANVHFKDLLEPEKSSISNYRTYKVSSFTDAFREAFVEGKYPNAKKFPSTGARTNTESLEDFLKKDGASIYMPYVEDVDPNELPTITFASVENSGDRVKGYRVISSSGNAGSRVSGYTLEEVMVDDDYSSEYQTWVIQPDDQLQDRYIMPIEPIDGGGGYSGGGNTGGGDGGAAGCPDSDKMEVLQVMIGWVKLVEQYDPYVGLYNSGGSEMMFVRGDIAYDPYTDETEAVPFSQPVDISRSDIRNKRWVQENQVWDPNWTEKKTKQVLGIYEWDNTDNEIKITGEASKKVTVKVDGVGVEEEVNVKVEFVYNSKDPVFTMQDWMYQQFKEGNKDDRGHGLIDGWRVYKCKDLYFTAPYYTSCLNKE